MLADLVVMSSANKPIVVVEARARKDTSTAWAQKFVQYYLAERPTTNEQFFVLATLEHIFIWRFQDPNAAADSPTCVLDTNAVIEKLMPDTFQEQVTAQSFETLIHLWLSSLLSMDSSMVESVPPQLFEIGFVDAIQNGSVVSLPTV